MRTHLPIRPGAQIGSPNFGDRPLDTQRSPGRFVEVGGSSVRPRSARHAVVGQFAASRRLVAE